MLLEEELVEMSWSSSNKKKYVDKGYIFTFMGDIFYAKAKDVLECSSGAKIPVKCDFCQETYYPTSRNYTKIHNRDGIDCCISCKGKKIKNTVQERYGVNNVMQVKEIVDKFQKTCMEKYNAPSPLENKDIFLKTKDSFNKHYNVNNGIADLRSVKELSDKIEETNKKKYDGISPFCSKEVRQKIRYTLSENDNCKTSKKQKELQEKLFSMYGNCELNYPCDESSLDCMVIVNGVKIDVEYDGWYWHKDRKEKDKRRDYFVRKQGYKVIRFYAYANRIPTNEEIIQAIKTITTTNKTFIKVELR